jgi:hypothetical protein
MALINPPKWKTIQELEIGDYKVRVEKDDISTEWFTWYVYHKNQYLDHGFEKSEESAKLEGVGYIVTLETKQD